MDKVDVKRLLSTLKQHKADPETLLGQAEQAYLMATEGYESEVPGKFGPQSVLTRNPAIAVQAVQQKLAIVKYLVEYVGEEEQQVKEMALTINLEAISEYTP